MVCPDPLDREPLRCLVGATASGKTALALEVAERTGAEILSLDSMLVYRGMDIGTAKPTPAERARAPHHLIDLVEPTERFDTRRWLRAARQALEDIHARGRRALFAGGTGLYLAVLLRGMFEGPPVDPAVRAAVAARAEAGGAAALHAELAERDPAAAERLHPNDLRRVSRALEVLEQTGRTLSDWQREWRERPSPRERRARIVGLELPRETLAQRIRTRAAGRVRGDRPARAGRAHDFRVRVLAPGRARGQGLPVRLGLPLAPRRRCVATSGRELGTSSNWEPAPRCRTARGE